MAEFFGVVQGVGALRFPLHISVCVGYASWISVSCTDLVVSEMLSLSNWLFESFEDVQEVVVSKHGVLRLTKENKREVAKAVAQWTLMFFNLGKSCLQVSAYMDGSGWELVFDNSSLQA